ncbi:hypothetical protein ACH40F_21250 [Streptomyces sp. NPDC020794]
MLAGEGGGKPPDVPALAQGAEGAVARRSASERDGAAAGVR